MSNELNEPDVESLGSPSESEDAELVRVHDDTGLDLATELVRRLTGRPNPPVTPKRVRSKLRPGVQFTSAGKDIRDPQPLGSLLGKVASEQGWATTLSVHMLLAQWSGLVGQQLADHSTPEAFEGGVLTIRCTSTAWATQVRLLAPSLLKSLNQRLGRHEIDRILAKGPDAPSWKHGRRCVSDGRGPRDTYG